MPGSSYIIKKRPEFDTSAKKPEVNLFHILIQLHESRKLIVEQISRLDGIIKRIVQFIRLQLIILEQRMIGFLRKEERRKIQSVYNISRFYPSLQNLGI